MNSKDFHDTALISAMTALIQVQPTATPAEVAQMAAAFADDLLEVRDAGVKE
jgi:hypothetical protein